MKTVYAFLADGMEEVEALMVIDLLRRTKKTSRHSIFWVLVPLPELLCTVSLQLHYHLAKRNNILRMVF